MAELIQETDSLNKGRVKLNNAINDAETARNTSENADDKADQALFNSESTQDQLDQVVIDGDSSVEAAQARVDVNGESHQTLKERIDDDYSDLLQVDEQIGTTTFTRTNGLVSQITTPTKDVTFTRDADGVVTSITEVKANKTVETTFTRDSDGVVQSIDKVVV
ncbi:hypothetical protein [Lentibacillus amyloliquefaciens]|uniref:Uncharacterized protein n=1 Tax=Lentibacillus amyloliquefaciens TaxID=1472767 RepID=A0A0U4EJ06_9BACI|nr:hypothetical protein [Lentibacillus amyloliquefaciens]ALX50473.1 hypothetical protein AOX59_18930 [Lentibacillus amyloliquefaciens]